ncbi:MAG: hypothetical protein QXQ39_07140 [Conexivisphaerales archaeon]
MLYIRWGEKIQQDEEGNDTAGVSLWRRRIALAYFRYDSIFANYLTIIAGLFFLITAMIPLLHF